MVAAGLGIIALVPVATALGDDDPSEDAGRSIEAATALGNSFTYQGRLLDGGSPANGTYDLRFILFDAESGGAQVGAINTREDVTVTNGLFAVELDFGAAAFGADARWVEIAVRPGSGTGTAGFTILSPRQPVSPTPFALYAKAAASIALPFLASGSEDGATDEIEGLMTIEQAGTGIAITGSRTSTDPSAYPAILGVNAGGGAGVQGESTADDGYGVAGFAEGADSLGGYFSGPTGLKAVSTESTGTGLEVGGALRVSGTTPTAFVHEVDVAGNTCGGGDDFITIIDNPLTNDDPDAILLVTLRNPITTVQPISVSYDDSTCTEAEDKWAIVAPALFADGDEINVLVIKVTAP